MKDDYLKEKEELSKAFDMVPEEGGVGEDSGDVKGIYIYMDEFFEGKQGVLIKEPDRVAPFLFCVEGEEDNEDFDITDEATYRDVAPIIEHYLQPYGRVAGRVGEITGYPVITTPSQIESEYVITKDGVEFRLYCLLIISTGKFITCYVPYDERLRQFDHWLLMHQEYRMKESYPVGNVTPKTPCGGYTLH